jgi:thioredoxin 1
MAIIHLTKDNFDSETASGPVLVDFWATWCGPCRMQAPVLEEFDKQMEGRVKVCKLDVDEAPNIAQRFGVMSIPTLIAFNDGKQLSKEIGVTSCEDLMLMFG